MKPSRENSIARLLSYFAVARLCDITWAHAVNTQARLRDALRPAATAPLFLECDLLPDPQARIILAHSPDDPADLTLDALLAAMKTTRQGLKLDFKHPAVVAPALTLLREADLKQPIILNADILAGPGGRPPLFDAADFIATCQSLYPSGILSLGWTSAADAPAGYTRRHVDAMLAACAGLDALAFAVRASFLPRSWGQMRRLLRHEGAVLSLWDGMDLAPQLMRAIAELLPEGDYLFDCKVAAG